MLRSRAAGLIQAPQVDQPQELGLGSSMSLADAAVCALAAASEAVAHPQNPAVGKLARAPIGADLTGAETIIWRSLIEGPKSLRRLWRVRANDQNPPECFW